VGHLPTAEAQGYLDPVSVVDEPLDLAGLGSEVVLVRLRAKADLLHEHDLLVLAGLPVLLLLLVLVGWQDAKLLAVVPDESNLRDSDLLVYPQVSTDCAAPILLGATRPRTDTDSPV
jgi:hypothetical protein